MDYSHVKKDQDLGLKQLHNAGRFLVSTCTCPGPQGAQGLRSKSALGMKLKPPPKGMTFEEKLETLRRVGGIGNGKMRSVDTVTREMKSKKITVVKESPKYVLKKKTVRRVTRCGVCESVITRRVLENELPNWDPA